ncbi:MAG: hypothetical protein NVSMB19_11650 [Vulcanimicrobiaceae bacterium]
MNVPILIAALAALVASPTAVPTAVPAPLPTRDPLAYDDPGMHFRAPDGWTRVALATNATESVGKRPPAAVYVLHPGKAEQRTILIDIQRFDGTLDGFERTRESELHSEADGTFVDRKTKTALGNGMPAYFVQVSQPGGQAGHQLRRYDFLVYDLQRSIDVAYIGRYGDFDEAEAKAALASLSVVVYPRRR